MVHVVDDGENPSYYISGIPFLTAPSDMRFLLVHDVSRSHEQLKSFFSDMNEILVKVRPVTRIRGLSKTCIIIVPPLNLCCTGDFESILYPKYAHNFK